MSGLPQRKPRLAEDPTAAVLNQHLKECSDKNQRVDDRLGKVEVGLAEVATNVAELTGQLKIIVGVFVKERPAEGGGSQYVWHIPKPSLKATAAVLGCFGGGIIVLQLLITMSVPALKAGIEWVMAYGH